MRFHLKVQLTKIGTFDIVTMKFCIISFEPKLKLGLDQNDEHIHKNITFLIGKRHTPEDIAKDIITLHERYLKR